MSGVGKLNESANGAMQSTVQMLEFQMCGG
jgi:hypothetical protein